MVRTCLDYVFIFRCVDNDKLMRNLWENYGDVVPNYSLFKKLVDFVCVNHHCLVIDRTTTSKNLDDIVYWYKAEKDERKVHELLKKV